MIHTEPKSYPAPDLRGHSEGIVFIPRSYIYNGGVEIDGDWYPGVKVPEPILSPGFELIGFGIGLQLNARPPFATMKLSRKRTTK